MHGRSRLRAVPLPGLPGAGRGDAVLPPLGAVLGRRAPPLPPDDLGGRDPARARARRHRAGRPRRVLPHLLGPHAVREAARDPGPGAGQCDQLDRVVHAGDQPGRADRPQPAVRALHQPGPDDLPGRRHRLLLGASRGGHPVHLPALRTGAHRDGLQPRHVPGAVRGPGGGLRARVPAPVGGPGGQGARDVRLGHGPPRPRGRWWVRRVLPAVGGRIAGRGPRGRAGRGPRPGRSDGPAAAARPARRQGPALEAAAGAGRSGRPTAVRLARRRPARSADGGPRRRPIGRRGRSGRHAGERHLAARRSRDRLRGGSGPARAAAAHRRPAGGSRRAASWSRRHARRTSWVGRRAGIRRRPDGGTHRSPGSSRSRRPSRAAAARSG